MGRGSKSPFYSCIYLDRIFHWANFTVLRVCVCKRQKKWRWTISPALPQVCLLQNDINSLITLQKIQSETEWPSSFANSKQKTHKETKASHENVLKESNDIRLSAHCLVSCCRFGPQFRRAMVVFVVPTLFFIHFYRCGFSMCLSLPFEKYVWNLFYTLYSLIEIHRL